MAHVATHVLDATVNIDGIEETFTIDKEIHIEPGDLDRDFFYEMVTYWVESQHEVDGLIGHMINSLDLKDELIQAVKRYGVIPEARVGTFDE